MQLFCQEVKFIRRFVHNNTLKPYERVHVFILPTVGVFNGKWRRGISPVRVKVHCKSTQVVIYCSKSVCWNWTESCSVSPREFKAFGVVVRLDHEPILRVCLVSQTMLLSYSTVFEVRTCG